MSGKLDGVAEDVKEIKEAHNTTLEEQVAAAIRTAENAAAVQSIHGHIRVLYSLLACSVFGTVAAITHELGWLEAAIKAVF